MTTHQHPANNHTHQLPLPSRVVRDGDPGSGTTGGPVEADHLIVNRVAPLSGAESLASAEVGNRGATNRGRYRCREHLDQPVSFRGKGCQRCASAAAVPTPDDGLQGKRGSFGRDRRA